MLNSSAWFCVMSTQPSLRCSRDILLPVFLLWPLLNHTVCFWTGQGRLEIRGDGDWPYLSVDVHHRVSAGDDRPLLTSLDIRNDLIKLPRWKPRPFPGTKHLLYEKSPISSLPLMRDTRSSGIIWETQVTSRWMPDIYHYQTAPESCLHAYRAGRQLHNMLN